MTKDTIIGLRANYDEITALDEAVAKVPLMNRTRYIKSAINAYAQKVIFQ